MQTRFLSERRVYNVSEMIGNYFKLDFWDAKMVYKFLISFLAKN